MRFAKTSHIIEVKAEILLIIASLTINQKNLSQII